MIKPALCAWSWAVICVFLLLDRAAGQTVIRPLVPEFGRFGTGESLRDGAMQDALPWGTGGVVQESMLEVPLPATEPAYQEYPITRRTPFILSAGPVLMLLSGDAIAMSDNNIFNTTKNPESDLIYTVTPRLMMGLGDYAEQRETFLSAGFAPSFVTFHKRHDLSDVDYDAFLESQYAFSRLKIGSRFSFERTTGANLDAPGRVTRDVYVAGLRLEYSLSDRTSAEVTGVFSHRDFLTQVDSDEYLTRNFVAYLVSPTLQVALGGALGTVQLANGQTQTYEQPLLRLWFQPGPKFSLRAIGGMELRQFNEGQPGHNTPVADFGIVYVPALSESTRLSLDGYRRMQSSSSTPGQNYLTTGVVFRVVQRVFRDLYLEVDAGYQRAAYYPTTPGGRTDRNDDYGYIRPRARYNLNDWGSASLFFHWRSNNSNQGNRSYENQHLGIELAVGF